MATRWLLALAASPLAALAASVGAAQPFRVPPPAHAPAPSVRNVDFDDYETLDDAAVRARATYWIELALYFVAAVLFLLVTVRGCAAMPRVRKALRRRRREAVPLDIGAQKRAARAT